MRLVGTYDFVGQPPKVSVDVVRNPSYPLTPAIVQRASLATLLSADGTSQTQATFQILTKAPYLEVELPDKASLWSAVLDGTPLKPQKQNKIRLIGLPPSPSAAPRTLQIVYEAPVESLASGHRLSLVAPRLLYRAGRDATQSTPIPLVNIEWKVTVPDGYEAVATDGTLEAQSLERPLPAPMVVAGTVYGLGGGFAPVSSARESGRRETVAEQQDLTTLLGSWGVDVQNATPMEVKADDRPAGVKIEASGEVSNAWRERGSPPQAASAPAAPALVAPSRRRLTQDNMVSDLPGAKRDYAANGGDASAATDNVAVTNGIVVNGGGALTLSVSAGSSSSSPSATAVPSGGFDARRNMNIPAPPPAAGGIYGTDTVAALQERSGAAPAPPLPRVPGGFQPGDAVVFSENHNPSSPASGFNASQSGRVDFTGPISGNSGVVVAQVSGQPDKSAGESDANWRHQRGEPNSPYALQMSYDKTGLSGFRSLKIDVQQTGMDQRQLLTFSSLGADPQIGITLARRNRNAVLVWGLALAAFVLGVALTGRPVRQKIALVLGLALASALLPLAWDTVSFARICNGVFYAAACWCRITCLPALSAGSSLCCGGLAARITTPPAPPASVTAALVLALVTLLSATARAQPQPAIPEVPVVVPGDAIIVPYDVKSETGVKDADHLLVPYDRYVELWNRAYPEKKIDAHPAPLPYALSGAAYSAVLEGEETLNVSGADADQRPGRGLRLGSLRPPRRRAGPCRPGRQAGPLEGRHAAEPESTVQFKGGKPAAAMDATLLVLQVTGKGTHKLEIGSAAEAGAGGRMARHHGSAAHGPRRHGHLPRAATADRGPPGPGRRPPHSRDAAGPTKRSRRPWGPAGPCNCSGGRRWRRPRSIAA